MWRHPNLSFLITVMQFLMNLYNVAKIDELMMKKMILIWIVKKSFETKKV